MTKHKKELSAEDIAKKLEKKRLKKERQERYFKELEEAKDDMIYHHKEKGIYTVYCPICNDRFEGSEYLKSVFSDERALWLSNMVMHYRHDHITSWNKNWGNGGWYYRQASHFGNYDEEKKKVNERAKRQIARKCNEFIIKNNVDKNVFLSLQNTTEETVKVVDKIFSK